MKRILVGFVVLAALIVSLQVAFALAGHHRKGEVFGGLNWPNGLAELAGAKNQVGGGWMNTEYDWYYFAGDAHDFNIFLENYSKLKGVPLKLVLSVGMPADKRLGDSGDPRKPISYDWTLGIVDNDRIRAVVKDPKRFPPKHYSATVTLWLGSRVDLRDVQVPENIDVVSTGEVDRFIAEHKAKQGKRKP